MILADKIFTAIRPKTLFASIAPVLIGFALFGIYKTPGAADILILLNIILAALIIQIISNLVNDLCDFKKGADTLGRVGPKRLLASGMASEFEVRLALIILVVLAILCGLPLVIKGGAIILITGLASILFAFLYTAGPWPLAYLGLGEIFVFIFFGPVAVLGTFYLFAGVAPITFILPAMIPGLISAAVLLVNNIRDVEGDKLASKNTLVVRYGLDFGRKLYFILLFAPALLILIFAMLEQQIFLMLPLLYSYFACKTFKHFSRIKEKSEFNYLLAETGKLNLIISALYLSLMNYPG
jgi:1,4-dihydroxy-2-naphthoate octaprenyltransferase